MYSHVCIFTHGTALGHSCVLLKFEVREEKYRRGRNAFERSGLFGVRIRLVPNAKDAPKRHYVLPGSGASHGAARRDWARRQTEKAILYSSGNFITSAIIAMQYSMSLFRAQSHLRDRRRASASTYA